ncbi:MAG: carboxyl transferase domain-containing protein [Solirubrobacteraceae bacterium]
MSAIAVTRPAGAAPAARGAALCDPGTYRSLGSAAGLAVSAGAGRVDGRPVYVWAQDPSVHGGSLGAQEGETIARVTRMASWSRAPVVGFVASGGARLQEGLGALTAYAGIFHAQALAEVPQIAIVDGVCAGGAAYSPALGDLVIMAGADARMFLTGPKIVARALREDVTAEALGGPAVHGANGVAHVVTETDVEAVAAARRLLGLLPGAVGGAPPARSPAPPRAGSPGDVVPGEHRRVYDVRDVAARIVDGGELAELGAGWARNLVTGLGRLEGRPVGVIANQPRRLGGVLDADASAKGAWFVEFCDRFGLPLAVLVDTPGFLPGTRQESAGVIRHGAALVRAFARARVPRATVTLRQAYGGAHIAMNSRDLGAAATFAWAGARIGVMGAREAVEIVERRSIAAGADPGALARAYAEEHLPAERAAAGGHVDEVIAPADTRARLALALL